MKSRLNRIFNRRFLGYLGFVAITNAETLLENKTEILHFSSKSISTCIVVAKNNIVLCHSCFIVRFFQENVKWCIMGSLFAIKLSATNKQLSIREELPTRTIML